MTTLDELVAAGLVATDVPLAAMTTYKLGGPARYFAEVADEAELLRVAEARHGTEAKSGPLPLLILGRGSNLAVADSGYAGLVIRLGEQFSRIDIEPDGEILAGGATPLPLLARSAVRVGRGGLEFFVGIPGSVGGAVCMNAGCHGSETKDWLLAARVADLEDGTASWRDPARLGMRYRHTDLASHHLVVAARFRTEPIAPDIGERRLREITRWRKQTQPGGTLNAGSVFKNPPGDAAGRIIDSLGLKGFRVGRVAVSEKHANFFVAEPGAPAQDIFDLVAAVRHEVAAATGIWLEPEIRFAGDFTGSAGTPDPGTGS